MRTVLAILCLVPLTSCNYFGVAPDATAVDGTRRALVITGPHTMTAGSCSAAFTVNVKDSKYASENSTGVPTPDDLAITLSGSASGGFYADSSCTRRIGAMTIAAGTSSASFYFMDLSAEAPALAASATDFDSVLYSMTVAPSAATQVGIIGPHTGTVGDCVGPYALTVQDAYSNAAPADTDLSYLVFTAPTSLPIYSDAACSVLAGPGTIAAHTSQSSFYVRSTQPADTTLEGLLPSQGQQALFSVSIAAGALSKVSIVGQNLVSAGDCTAGFAARLTDVFGNLTSTSASVTAVLASLGSAHVFSDAGCTTPYNGNQIPFAPNQSQVSFYFQDTAAETLSVTAASGVLNNDPLPVTVTPKPAVSLSFTGPSTATAGACTALIVQLIDLYGNGSALLQSVNVGLADAVNGSFYTDPTCTSAHLTNQATIPAHQSSTTVYLRDTVAEDLVMHASYGGITTSLHLGVQAAAANKIQVNGPSTVNTLACSAAITLSAIDAFGNTVTLPLGQPHNLGFLSTGAGAFYTSSSCDTLATSATLIRGNSATVYFKSAFAQSLTIQFVDQNTPTLLQGSLPLAVLATAPANILLNGPQAPQVGNCYAYTVNVVDAGNSATPVSPAHTVNLTGVGHGHFYGTSDPTCAGAAITTVNVADTTSAVTIYFQDTMPEVLQLLASDVTFGIPKAATLDVAVTAGNAHHLNVVGQSTIPTNTCAAYAVTIMDASGNPIRTGSSVLLNLSASAGQFYDSSCTGPITTSTMPANATVQLVYYKATVASASNTLTVASAGLVSGTQSVTVVGSAVTHLDITGTSPVTAGTCSPFTVTAKDGSNVAANVGADTAVALLGNANGAFYTDGTCGTPTASVTIANGTSSKNFWFLDNVAQTTIFSAGASGVNIGQLPVVIAAGTVTKIGISGGNTLTAGSCGAYTLSLLDAQQNLASTGSSTAIALSGNGSGAFYGDSGCTGVTIASASIGANASSTTIYFKDPASQALTFVASKSPLPSGTISVIVTNGAASSIKVSGSPSANAGVCAGPYSVSEVDASGNVLTLGAAQVVTISASNHAALFTNGSCNVAAPNVTIGMGASSASFYLLDSLVESTTLTGSVTGLGDGTLGVTVKSAPASALVLTGSTPITASECSSAFIVTLKDAAGNTTTATGSTGITFGGNGAGTFYSDAGCSVASNTATIAVGSSTALVYLRDATIESLTLTATGGGLTAGSLPASVVAGSPSKLGLTGPPTATTGVCAGPYTVSVKDVNNNAATAAADISVALGGPGQGVFYSDGACSSQSSSAKITNGSSSTTFYFKDGTAESVTLTTNSTSLSAANYAVTIAAPPPSPPNNFRLTGPSSGTTAQCLTFNVVTYQGASPTAVTTSTPFNFSGYSPGNLYSGTGCSGSTITSITFTIGTYTMAVSFKTSTAQAYTLGADGGSLGTNSIGVTISLPPPPAWAYLNGPGPSTYNGTGHYGTMGVADPLNYPPSRNGFAWTRDSSGRFWMYGGDASYADLWMFDGSNWTWVSGPQGSGVANASGRPNARSGATLTADSSGNLWLYGGSASTSNTYYCDLWKFDGANWSNPSSRSSANLTTCTGTTGSSGVFGSGYYPGRRANAASWVDAQNRLWLFGGGTTINDYFNGISSTTSLNDLWEFDPSSGNWAYISGQVNNNGTDGTYSTPPYPPGVTAMAYATDNAGNFYFYGGIGTNGGYNTQNLGSLWKHSGSTWSHLGPVNGVNATFGSLGTSDSTYTPGARSYAGITVDSQGRIYLYGGSYHPTSGFTYSAADVWRYDTSGWALMTGGQTTGSTAVPGTMGVSNSANTPGGRVGLGLWLDLSDNLFLFGGYTSRSSDVWTYR